MGDDFNPRDHVRKLSGRGGPAEYLDVKWRLVWFRNDHPNGDIETELVQFDMERGFALFKATVRFPDAVRVNGEMMRGRGGMASGYGSETAKDFGDFIEKAETKAIGRALNALGYGTQSMPDDGERIADAPVERHAPQTRPAPQEQVKPAARTNTIPKDAEMAQPALAGTSNAEADWITLINDVQTAAQLGTLHAELSKANASRTIWDAYGRKAKAINSTS